MKCCSVGKGRLPAATGELLNLQFLKASEGCGFGDSDV